MKLAPLLVVLYSALVFPPEVEFSIFGINFPSYRIALLLLIWPAFWRLLRDPSWSPGFFEASIAIVGFWTLLSFTVVYGFEQGLVRGAGITIDTVLPFLIARACIRSLDDLRYVLILTLPALMLAGASLALESLSGRLIVRPAFASVFGSIDNFVAGQAQGDLVLKTEYRLGGLLRAFGPFPHPILAGIVMIGFLPLYYFSSLRSWVFMGGIFASLTGFFGLSSAAFLALILSFGAIAIFHVKAFIPRLSWWTISMMLLLLLWALHMGTKNGILAVVSRITLSPGTADYRQLIWQWGWINIQKHPWFGLGYKSWERLDFMGESVDAHFLLLAIRHGVIIPIVLFVGIVFAVVRLGIAIPYLEARDRALAIGLNICIVNYVLVGQTVNYFGSALIVFMLLLGVLAGVEAWGGEQKRLALRRQVIENLRLTRARVNLPSPVQV